MKHIEHLADASRDILLSESFAEFFRRRHIVTDFPLIRVEVTVPQIIATYNDFIDGKDAVL